MIPYGAWRLVIKLGMLFESFDEGKCELKSWFHVINTRGIWVGLK